MLRVQGDDMLAFDQLVHRYQSRLIRVISHQVGADGSAEDLAQDVFIRLWRARKAYKPTARFSTYIFHIANNVVSNAIRDRKRRREYQVFSVDPNQSGEIPLEQLAVASTGSLPLRRLDSAERAEMVRAAVDALNPRQRLSLLLCKFEGLSYQEIGQVMNLSEKAVKSLLSRARVNLKIILEPFFGETKALDVEPVARDEQT